MTGLADTITSDSMDPHSLGSSSATPSSSWPFVTVRNFEVKAAHARQTGNIDIIGLCPLVSSNQRKAWEQYALDNAAMWLLESRSKGFQEADVSTEKSAPTGFPYERRVVADTDLAHNRRNLENRIAKSANNTTTTVSNEIIRYIHQGSEEVVPSGDAWTYVPGWQISPPPADPLFVNLNVLSYPKISAAASDGISSKQQLLTMFVDVSFIHHGIEQFPDVGHSANQSAGQLPQYLLPPPSDMSTQPHSVHITPIKGSFDEGYSVVALLLSVVDWDKFFSRLLPEGSNGIFAVLQNSCEQSVTFEINGPTATFVGVGDLHDPFFSSTGRSITLSGNHVPTVGNTTGPRATECGKHTRRG
jgi:hypothetical protein